MNHDLPFEVRRPRRSAMVLLLAKALALLAFCTISINPVSANIDEDVAAGDMRQQTIAGQKDLLSPEERQWLAQHPGIRIGITVIPPQILHDQEEYKGLSIDYIRLLEEKLGYRFELIPYATWNEVIEAAKTRQIDMIFAAQKTPERSTYLQFSKAYIELPNMILVRRDHSGGSSLKAMKGWHVAVSEGSAVHEYLKTNFPDLSLVPVQDELNGLMEVSLGEADAMVVEISRASYYIDKAGILNLRVAGDAEFLYQLRFAVRNDWPVLTGILDKALDTITAAERETINRHWILVEKPSIFSSEVFWIALGIIVLSVFAVVAWNLSLQRIVSHRTSQVRLELAERKRTERDLLLVRFALDSVREAVLLIDEDACFQFVNEGACKVLGYTRDELLEMRVSDVDPNFPMQRWSEHWRQLKTERSLLFEGRHRAKDGRIFPVEISANYFQYGDQEFNLALVRDITERKQTEEKILRSEQRLRLHAEQSPLGFLEWDENFCAAEWNAACEKIFGYTREEALGRHAKDLILPVEVRDLIDGIFRDLMNQTGGTHSINENVTKDGRIIICEWFNTTLRDKDGKAIGVASVCRDITELKKTEQERQLYTDFLANMDRVNRAIQSAGDLEIMMQDVLDEVLDIFDCDRSYLLYPCDPAASTFSLPMERTRKEFPGASVKSDDIPIDSEVSTTMASLLNAPGVLQFGPGTDHPLPSSTSERFGFKSFMSTALFPKSDKAWEFGIQQCSRERVWTQEEEKLLQEIGRRLTDGLNSLLILRDLRESEARYQRMFDTANEGIWVQDEDFVTIFANERMAKMLGYTSDELRGHKVTEYMFEEGARDHAQKMEERRRNISDVYERRMRHKDGSPVWMLISATPVFEDGQFHGSFAMLTDITDRKEAEQRLVASEQLFRTLVEHSPDYIARYDLNLQRIYVNPTLQSLFAVPVEQALGKPPTVSSPLTDPERYMDNIRKAIETASECSDEHTYRKPNGEIRWAHTRFVPEFESAGKVATVMVISQDVTQQKQVEMERRFHTEFLSAMDRINRAIQGAGDLETMMSNVLDEVLGILNCDRAFLVYPCDPSAKSWTVPMERTRPEYPGAGILNAEIPMSEEVATTLQLMLKTPGVVKFGPDAEHSMPKAISERYGIKSFMSLAVYPKVGKAWQFGIHQCSYERMWTNEEGHLLEEIGRRLADGLTSLLVTHNMRESERRLVEAQHLAHIGNWELDLIEDVLTWSDEIYQIFEIDKEEFGASYEAFLDAIHPDDRKAVNRAYTESVETRKPYNIVHRLLMQDGRVKYVNERCETTYDAVGKPLRSIGTVQDITEQKLREDELRRYRDHLEEEVRQRTAELRLARDEAETANKAKSAFLANMSHELRTPLNAILGFSQMMQQDTGLNKGQHEILDIINNSGEHLLKLINDVLEIAKIEAGKLQLELATFDLHSLVREVTDMMRLRAQQKGLQLELDQSSEFPRYIKGDEARLRQILVNLVSNAVKFTEKGGVTIRLGNKDNALHHLVIEVEDTGPGISKQDQQHLFQPFVQLPEGKTQVGSGLGLSIVQQFVKLMSGTVSVKSEPGKGSLFRVELPLEAADDTEVLRLEDENLGEVEGLAPGQSKYRILIAEDQHDNQMLLSKMMTDLGLEVKVADNGEECVQIFKQWKPDLIWMDRRMPVMDGVEATRRIRRMRGGKKVKIVAVTASAFKEQEPELRDAGMDDYIRKPFRFEEIYDSMSRQLGLEFIYRTEPVKPKISHETLTPKRLMAITTEQREELYAAVESLDRQRIDAAIRQIAAADAELGRALSLLANEFDYPTILNVLKAKAGK